MFVCFGWALYLLFYYLSNVQSFNCQEGIIMLSNHSNKDAVNFDCYGHRTTNSSDSLPLCFPCDCWDCLTFLSDCSNYKDHCNLQMVFLLLQKRQKDWECPSCGQNVHLLVYVTKILSEHQTVSACNIQGIVVNFK